jgi:hypothetical protein
MTVRHNPLLAAYLLPELQRRVDREEGRPILGAYPIILYNQLVPADTARSNSLGW